MTTKGSDTAASKANAEKQVATAFAALFRAKALEARARPEVQDLDGQVILRRIRKFLEREQWTQEDVALLTAHFFLLLVMSEGADDDDGT